MIRSNMGNIVTNGMQILSVGSTTASRIFRNENHKSLNNRSYAEQSRELDDNVNNNVNYIKDRVLVKAGEGENEAILDINKAEFNKAKIIRGRK